MSDAAALCKRVLEDLFENVINDCMEMEEVFMKGHLSPKEYSAPIEDESGGSCEICGEYDTCDVCRLPVPINNGGQIRGNELSCCCKRQCKLKSLLFDIIGECCIFIDTDKPKAMKFLNHVKGDLEVAVREINDKLLSIQNQGFSEESPYVYK